MSPALLAAAPAPPAALYLLGAAGAYLCGSIPFGYLVARAKGVDIRQHGSGNIGATNVLRVIGKPWGIAVFLLDFLKGLLPVLAAHSLTAGATGLLATLPLTATLAAILGHNYTCWLRFRGGKGIATSAGALCGLAPWAVLAAALVWGAVFSLTRYVAVASIAAALSLPVTVAILAGTQDGSGAALLAFTTAIALLAVWRHRSNIARLRAGTEHRFGRPSPPSPPPGNPPPLS